MAYAALVSLAQTIDLILNHDKYSISVDAKEEITSIRQYVIFLVSFLEDFPEKANRLEGKIRDVANEAEDIIEFFMWKQIQSYYKWMSPSRVEFEHKLKKVSEEIGSIAGEMMDDRAGDLPAAAISSSSSSSSSSSTLAPTCKNDKVIGLDEDLIAIKGRLCGESFERQVIPIVGMGGMGKTTLARNAYEDPLIRENFYIRAWVTISQDYSAGEIISCLLESIQLFEEQISGQKPDDSISVRVYKILKGRKYLIVIDDVWSTKAWDDVRHIFPDDGNGSRIMLTTRLSDVATYAANSCSPLHEMQFMNEDQSWNLLKQKVFTDGQDCPPELKDIGEYIARSCRGLPLAVVLVAGILSTVTKTRSSWREIATSVNSVIDGQVEKILYLSYTHLPHYLRPCFLFMAGFPEDYKIHVSKLIKLWVAEGFLKHQKELEEKAEEYLEDLVKRSLVLVTSRKSNGKIKSCTLHDLVRDLCIRTAQEEKFLLHVKRTHYVLQGSITHERRVSTHALLDNMWGQTIHTILWLYPIDSTSLAFVANFRLLRVLDVVCSQLKLLLPQVFELFHLRYLALNYYVKIPSAISNLENLQTLIIHSKSSGYVTYCSSFLPLEIWRMPQLRHLVFSDLELPDPEDISTLPLENLQTLSTVASLVCRKSLLKMIPNLKKLGIVYFENQEYHYQLHNLIYLHQLEKLKITMCSRFSWRGQNLAFPTTLKKLTLVGGRLPWKDMNIVGSLPNLEILKLRDFACDGDTWEVADGKFPQLKFLLIQKSDLQHWITETSETFPTLERLLLHCCLFLSQIPDAIGEIPTLELIEVDDRNKSLTDSIKHIQEEQKIYGNEALQVRCVRLEI